MITYYGIYKNYQTGKLTLDVSDSVDGMSCEMQAEPGLMIRETPEDEIIERAIAYACQKGYDYVEINMTTHYELFEIKDGQSCESCMFHIIDNQTGIIDCALCHETIEQALETHERIMALAKEEM